MRRGQRFILRVGGVALCISLVGATPALAVPASSTATPTVPGNQVAAAAASSAIGVTVDSKTQALRRKQAQKQAELDALNSRLDQLQIEAEYASEAANEAQIKLDDLHSRLATAQADLANAKQAYEVQADLLAGRASEIYRDGNANTIEIVLGSKSLPDFFRRLEFLGVIGQADADLAEQLATQRDQIAANAADLQSQSQQAEAAQFELATRKREVELQYADLQAVYANTQKDLMSSLDAQQAVRDQNQSALIKQILTGVQNKGIVVAPGSPVETALAYHGVPYLWGGATPAGFDCSGLIMYVFAQHGVVLPHYSGAQFQLGMHVDRSQLIPGDVVFFGSPIHHVGLYIGGGYFLEAPHTGDYVKVSLLANRSDFAGARRYPWLPRVGKPAGLDQLSSSVDHNHGVPIQGIYSSVR